MYLMIAALLTCITMIWIARRMQARRTRSDRRRGALPADARQHHRRQPRPQDGAALVPVHRHAVPLHHVSNLIGYIPLPTNTERTSRCSACSSRRSRSSRRRPTLSIPLALALVRVHLVHDEGIRAKGPIGYLRGLVPHGVEGGMAVFIFFLEVLSNLMRLLSLSIRLLRTSSRGT